MIAETFFQLLRDPAHWEMELFLIALFDGLIGVVGVKLWHRWHKRHDETVHKIEPYWRIEDLAAIEDLHESIEKIWVTLREMRRAQIRPSADWPPRY